MANRWSSLGNFQDASEPLITAVRTGVNACLTEISDDGYNAKACPFPTNVYFHISSRPLLYQYYRDISRDSAPHGKRLNFCLESLHPTHTAYYIKCLFLSLNHQAISDRYIPSFRNAHSRTAPKHKHPAHHKPVLSET